MKDVMWVLQNCIEGRIIVSGGQDINVYRLNTVEAYDHVVDSWSYMPNMIERRAGHKSVAIRSKLFVVGELDINCEVFDSTCKQFVYIKKLPPRSFLRFEKKCPTEIVSIGSQIAVFAPDREILFYDVDNDEWSEKSCDATKDLELFACSKVRQV